MTSDINDLLTELRANEMPNDRQFEREARITLAGLHRRAADALVKLRADNERLRAALTDAIEYMDSGVTWVNRREEIIAEGRELTERKVTP